MQTALIIIASLVIGFLLLNVYARFVMKKIPKVADHADILTLTDQNFDQQLKNKVVLVDFYADWCAPCKMMIPILNDVAETLSGNTHVGKVDTGLHQSVAARYNVRSIPTMVVFKNGKEVKRFVGVKPKEESSHFRWWFCRHLNCHSTTEIGIGADKMQHKGVEHTLTICGKSQQTFEFRDKLDSLIQKGSGKIAIGFGGNPKDKSTVRGGPGFELLFNIDHYLRKKGIRDRFELTMFAPMEEPGARMGKKAMKAIQGLFAKQNLNKRFGKKITEFVEDGVLFEDGSKLQSDLTMFIAAGTDSAILKAGD